MAMDSYAASVDFIRALSLRPQDRTDQDVGVIGSWLRRLDIFRRLGDGPMRAVARSARYERHPASQLLFRRGQPASRWFILLSGSVFIDGHMYLPRACFGRRTGVSNRRATDCLVLEPSEMIVIDYPERGVSGAGSSSLRKGVQSMNLEAHQTTAPQTSSALPRQYPPPESLQPPSAVMRNLYYPGRQGSLHRPHHAHRQPQPPRHVPFGAGLLQRPLTTARASATISVNGPGHETAGPSTRHHHPHPPPYNGHISSSSSSRSTETLMEEEGEGTLGRPSRPPNSTERDVAEVLHRSEVYLSGEGEAGGRAWDGATRPRRGSARSSTSSDPRTVSTGPEDELAGLPEGNVDSEEEDDESCPSGDSFLELRDNVRECLEKEPDERTEAELEVLLEFLAHMPAFANLPLALRRELCTRMVFAMVEKAGKVVMKDGEQLDSWCVIVNGEVEVVGADGSRSELAMGDSFGVEPVPETQYQRGTMRTLIDDCQFVLVTQEHYVAIMRQLGDQLRRHTDAAGEVVSETERRTLDSREGYVLIKGKPDKLLAHLVEERDGSVDPFYVEDFLLTYRTFIPSPVTIFKALLGWFQDPSLRDKVARLVLLWVNNHFNDFETSVDMMKLLEEFESQLEREGLSSQQQLLNIACSVKSRSRIVSYTRSNREESLQFSVLGGAEKRQGIFVAKVEPGSKAASAGLKRGDQVLEVNNVDFGNIAHQRALDVLRGTTHLSLTLKSNLLGFKELLNAGDSAHLPPPAPAHAKLYASKNGKDGSGKLSRKGHSTTTLAPNTPFSAGTKPNGSLSMPPKEFPHYQRSDSKISKQISRFMDRIRPNAGSLSVSDAESHALVSGVSFNPGLDQVHPTAQPINKSFSNPDLNHIHQSGKGSGHQGISGGISQYYPASATFASSSGRASHAAVLKVYRVDQSYKYLSVYEETTAAEVVRLALQEFGMTAEASAHADNWSLFKVTVTAEGVTKQSRLPDQIHNLAEKMDLNSRYYLKNQSSTAPLLTDQVSHDLQRESATHFLHLNAAILAAQITLSDFAIYAAIEPTEYIDDLFKKDSAYGCPKLRDFENLVNQEMWWVVTEICREKNSAFRRAKLVKKFIKVAKHCRDFRNFNTMFAILSGLDKPAVRRLHQTWDRVPAKYSKLLTDLQALFAPSRNMSTYRAHLSEVALEPPALPLFPVLKKDLTFIHEGNPTITDGLVNFEKLRMLGKEIRGVTKLASAPYELSSMFEEGDSHEALIQVNPYDNSVATMRRPPPAKAPLSRKKLYERALMVRKVKAYLAGLSVVDSEQELDRLSLECEAGVGAGSLGNVAASRAAKRQPSPSPSSASSFSNTSNPSSQHRLGPKFGVESPQAVQKMLSLVENSRSVVPSPPAPPASHLSCPSGSSPAASPLPPRRQHRHRQPVPPEPVPLSADCSTVHPALIPPPESHRISCSGSVTSTDSAVSGGSGLPGSGGNGNRGLAMSHAVSCDSTDSGHASIDAAAASSTLPSSTLPSPPPHRGPPARSALRRGKSPKGRAPPPPSPSVAHRAGDHPGGPPPRRRSGSRPPRQPDLPTSSALSSRV